MYFEFYVGLTSCTEAVVGLERTSYEVLENVGVVGVCVIVFSSNLSCPIDYPFEVRFSTNDGSAGILHYFV